MSNALPISPISPDRFRETQQIADEGRLRISLLEAEQRTTAARAQETLNFFRAAGETGKVLANQFATIAERQAFNRRMEAKQRVGTATSEWMRETVRNKDLKPDQLLPLYLEFRSGLKENELQGIGWRTQSDIANLEFDQDTQIQGQKVLALADDMTLQAGLQALNSSLGEAIREGNVESVYNDFEDAVETGYLPAAALEPGGERDKAVRRAGVNQLEFVAQQVFEAEGLEAAKEYVLTATNHDDKMMLTDSDLRGVFSNIRGQAEAGTQRMELVKGEDMAEFILWSIPYTSGHESITLKALRDQVDGALPRHSSLEKAKLIRDTYEKTQRGSGGARGATSPEGAQHRREVIMSLEKASRGLTSENVGHYYALVNRHFQDGDFGDGAGAAAEYRRWLSVLDKDAAEVDRIAQPGESVIDSVTHIMSMTHVAAGRAMKEGKYFIGEKGLYEEEGDRQALILEPGEGDLFAVHDPQGRLNWRSFTEIGDEMKAELRAMVRQSPGDLDVATAAMQILHRELAAMKPGVQDMEWVDATGTPAPADWTIAPVGVGKGRRERFPDVEALDAGLSFIGERGGLDREQLTIGTRPLGDGRTGAPALKYIAGREGWETPMAEARGTMWQGLMDEGMFIEAAELAADGLPRDVGQLAEMRRAGALYDFTDHGDGSFSVQYVPGGVVYPVFPIEEGDDAALTALWFPNLLDEPEGQTLAPGGVARGASRRPAVAPAAAPPPPPLSAQVTELDTELANLQREWDSLGSEYLSVNEQINVAPPLRTLATAWNEELGQSERSRLAAQQEDLASQRREVGARITALRERRAVMLDEEFEKVRRVDELNGVVLDEILMLYGEF